MNVSLLRNSLKIFVAVLITAAIASWSQRVEFLWYPLLAVVVVVDDNDDQTIKAASSRILGTAMGGLVPFLVHTVLAGWIGVLVSLLLMIPVLRIFGWQSGLGTAGLVSVMFLMIPSHTELNWNYVFNRALDTMVGCAVALAVGLMFWPRNSYKELQQADASLTNQFKQQLYCYQEWLLQAAIKPQPLPVASLTAALQRMEQLVGNEKTGPQRKRLQRSGWIRRMQLWQQAQFHWVAWERLMAETPSLPQEGCPLLQQGIETLSQQLWGHQLPTPERNPHPWQHLAQQNHWPLLPLLALHEELRPLHASLGALGARQPCQN